MLISGIATGSLHKNPAMREIFKTTEETHLRKSLMKSLIQTVSIPKAQTLDSEINFPEGLLLMEMTISSLSSQMQNTQRGQKYLPANLKIAKYGCHTMLRRTALEPAWRSYTGMQKTNHIPDLLSAVVGQAHSFLMEWKKSPTGAEYGRQRKHKVQVFDIIMTINKARWQRREYRSYVFGFWGYALVGLSSPPFSSFFVQLASWASRISVYQYSL